VTALLSASASHVHGPAAHAGAGGGQLVRPHLPRPLRGRPGRCPLPRVLRGLRAPRRPLQHRRTRGLRRGRVLSHQLPAQRGSSSGSVFMDVLSPDPDVDSYCFVAQILNTGTE
jgi:hypothetical protein